MSERDEYEVVALPLSALIAHRDNCNVMQGEAYEKLKTHLKQHDRYPPVIVRKKNKTSEVLTGDTAEDTELYELLDGHHRVKALRELGRKTVRCVVWDVDDNEAKILLATLNRLRGRDDPRKRAALLASLSSGFDRGELLRKLPESPEKLKRLLELDRDQGPRLSVPKPLETMPVAVYFFLLPEQKSRLDAALRLQGGTREEALMAMAERIGSIGDAAGSSN